MTLYLYDPRYNLKTETSYEKLTELFGVSKSSLASYKSRKIKIHKKYYVIDDKATKDDIRKLYSKEIFKNEVWKEIEGSEGNYLISDHGRFKKIYKKYPEGKLLLPYFKSCFKTKKKNNEHKQLIKVKFQGIYKEYTVARLVAYHFVDIYYTKDSLIRKSKADKYKYYKYDELSVYHKNELIYDNTAQNLEWLDKEDIGKKTGHKSNKRGTVIAKDAITGEVINYFRSATEASKHLYVSAAAVLDSLNHRYKTNIVGGTYIFEYEE